MSQDSQVLPNSGCIFKGSNCTFVHLCIVPPYLSMLLVCFFFFTAVVVFLHPKLLVKYGTNHKISKFCGFPRTVLTMAGQCNCLLEMMIKHEICLLWQGKADSYQLTVSGCMLILTSWFLFALLFHLDNFHGRNTQFSPEMIFHFWIWYILVSSNDFFSCVLCENIAILWLYSSMILSL